MKIGIYGGTFDPPHLGHMAAAREIRERLGLDRLILIPDRTPPHKELSPLSAGPEERLAMTARMADGLDPWGDTVTVSDLELRREGASYTADTLETLAAQYPEDELWLLMGSDMLLSIRGWHAPEKICRLAHICAFTRSDGDDMAAMETVAEELRRDYGGEVELFRLRDGVDVSSTELRMLLSQNVPEAENLLWCQVYGFILEKGLYGVKAALDRLTEGQLRAVAYSMMRAKRIPHVQGAESEAERLAKRWNANVEYARRAAILHDCTKYFSVEEHLAVCRRFGVTLDEIEQNAEKLLHAKTGAALARYVFGEPEEVCAAICYHTTGKGNMSLLEKILYIADYMEPYRCFPGVDVLRRLAYEDLDGAVRRGCEMSIEEMAEKGRTVHPNTYAAIASLKGMEL